MYGVRSDKSFSHGVLPEKVNTRDKEVPVDKPVISDTSDKPERNFPPPVPALHSFSLSAHILYCYRNH